MKKERQWSRSISTRNRDIAVSGCMGGMLHYFDFHSLLFNAGHGTGCKASSNSVNHSDLRNPSTKGLEAPRNSLEGAELDPAKTSSFVVEEEYFEIPMGVQLAPAFDILPNKIKKHSRKHSLLEDERIPQTPETPRTPGLVARLMGIDGLPDPAPSPPATACQKQPSKSAKNQLEKKELRSSKLHECKKEQRQPLRSINCNARLSDAGSRSLPDTPRVSSERSRDLDSRLSLQIHRENSYTSSRHSNVPVGEYSLPPSPTHYTMKPRRKYQDENKSPSKREYAKEIMKQMKESIANRKENGSDDGNSKSRRANVRGSQKDDRGSRKKPVSTNASHSPPSPQAISTPPAKIAEPPTKAKLKDHIPNLHVLTKPIRMKSSRSPPPPPVQTGKQGKCKKGTNERFTARFKKPISPAAGSMGIGTGDKNFSVVIEKSEITPSLFRSPQQKKDDRTFSVQTKIPRSCRTRPDQDLEYKYIRSILHRGGFMGPSQVIKRYSPLQPVDPIVFHQLEVELPVDDTRYRSSALRYRWNRKHLFHLVEELLSDLLDYTGRSIQPLYNEKYTTFGKTSCYTYAGSGTELLRRIWRQIVSIPSADCQYLADIDALVAVDMPVSNIRELTRHPAVRNQASDVAAEVEQEILEELIGETAASLSLSSLCL